MRLSVRLPVVVWAVLAFAACGGSTEGPVATSVAVSPTTNLNMTALNQTTQLTAAVLDQHGDTIPNISFTWLSNNTAVATVSTNGLVTAKSAGSTTITITGGGVQGTVNVSVAQVPASVAKAAGDGQSATVGTSVATSLTVQVLDATANPITGVTVTFAVTSGGGSVGTPSTTTDGTGNATTTWTLGTNSTQTQRVTATAGAAQAIFTATATPGAAANVLVNAGNNQTAATGAPVTTAPSVKVTDSFGNAKSGVSVTFAPANGTSGSVTGATKTTNASGVATVGSWTLGSAGTNSLNATANGVANPFTFTATAVTPAAPTTMTLLSGQGQTGLVGYTTNLRPAVKVTDAQGFGVPGVSVMFAPGGGGSVTGGTVNTNAQGIAQVGSWTLGASAGANTLTVTSAGLTGSPITFNATGATQQFTITLQNIGPAFSPSVQAAFDSAKARWERIIYGDVPDISINLSANACGSGTPAINQIVDDVLILARIDAIDGPGNILGQAGFCVFRNGSLLPIVGVMTFDSADLGALSQQRLRDVILHEMGHVLGFGTLWPNPNGTFNGQPIPGAGCLNNPSAPNNPVDTYFNAGSNVNTGFTCTQAPAMFDSLGGLNWSSGTKVPVENGNTGFGLGSINSHWRETSLKTELMTPAISGAGVTNELSMITIASMGDLGYLVNYAAGDAYAVPQPFAVSSMAAGAAGTVSLEGDVWKGPLYEVTVAGGIRRVR